MPYQGEVLAVQTFIKEMTGHEIREAVIRAALEKAEAYREREDRYERDPQV